MGCPDIFFTRNGTKYFAGIGADTGAKMTKRMLSMVYTFADLYGPWPKFPNRASVRYGPDIEVLFPHIVTFHTRYSIAGGASLPGQYAFFIISYTDSKGGDK